MIIPGSQPEPDEQQHIYQQTAGAGVLPVTNHTVETQPSTSARFCAIKHPVTASTSLPFQPTQQDSLGLLRTSWPNSSSIKEVEKGQTPSHRDAGPAGAAGTGGWSHPRELLARRINDRLWPTVFLRLLLTVPQMP